MSAILRVLYVVPSGTRTFARARVTNRENPMDRIGMKRRENAGTRGTEVYGKKEPQVGGKIYGAVAQRRSWSAPFLLRVTWGCPVDRRF